MTTRTQTPLDRVAEAYVDTLVQLSPITATHIGAPGHDHELDDFSPAGLSAKADAAREALRHVEATEIVDDVDRVTAAAMRERLGLDVELFEAGEDHAQLNNIASPLQGIRDIFDLMPTVATDHWEVIAERMGAVPAAIDGYIESLRLSVENGPAPAVRQFEIGVAQAVELAGPGSFWDTFAASADVPDPLAGALASGADAARAAYGRLAEALRELAPRAPQADGVGRERYQRLSRQFLGATIDLDETYEWGREELARIVAEQDEVAHQLYGDGTTADEAMRRLDEDVTRQLHGADALQRWMQETSDAAVEALAGTHFDIADPIRRLECRIAPTHNGGI